VRPQHITLTDQVSNVVWECADLPPGGELVIAFLGDPRGPFVRVESSGNQVIGYGNRGPDDTSRHYEYEARVETDGAVQLIGPGEVLNNATDPSPSERPLGPPWGNTIIDSDGGSGENVDEDPTNGGGSENGEEGG
jgi:hypothetical protein